MTAHIDAATLKAWLGDGARDRAHRCERARAIRQRASVLRRAAALQPVRAGPAGAGAEPGGAPRAVRPGRRRRGAGGRAGRRLGLFQPARSGSAASRPGSAPATRFLPASMSRARPSASSSPMRAIRRAYRPMRWRPCGTRSENFVIVDGRPFAEYRKMSIPGGICCPNGELALRIQDIAPDPRTKIVVNCAGRTRSIIGAQTLLDLGVPNPVYALENGTQGWFLAGLELEHGAQRHYADRVGVADIGALQARARHFAERPRRPLCGARCRAGVAARSGAHHLLVGCAHRRGGSGTPGAGLPACARRPADPGDRCVGRGQRAPGWCWPTTSWCGPRWWPAGCASSATRPACSTAASRRPRRSLGRSRGTARPAGAAADHGTRADGRRPATPCRSSTCGPP